MMNKPNQIQSDVERQVQLWATDPVRMRYTNRMLDIIQRHPIQISPLKNESNTVLDKLSEQLKDYLTQKYPLLYYVPTN